MSKFNRIQAIGTLAAALTLTLGGAAQATEFGFKGSDTLFDVLTDAVTNYKAELGLTCAAGSDCVKYLGTGSGNGEKSMALHTAANTPFQRIAGMSRNMTAAAQTTCNGRVGAGLCNPELKNVLGLDAAVVAFGSGSFTTCPNVQVGSQPDGTALPNNLMALILGGKGGTGDWVACSAPERVQAIQSLLDCSAGLGAFSHFYRRDDSSGTSDSVREKLQISRFCNGSHKPAAGQLSANLVGPDNDPIRTACPAPSASRKPVRCTVTDPTNTASYLKDCSSKRCSAAATVAGVSYAAGFLACTADSECAALGAGTCTAGLASSEPGCTAGFVVSLSEPDNTQVTDITMAIAQRILDDASAVGYAGREAIRKAPISGQPAKGARVNTNQASDSNVRQDKYLMARRLFLHDTCNQNAGVAITTDTTGDAARDAAECQFFKWATDELPEVSGKSGRENIDPIMAKFGFLPCQDDFGQPTGDGNLCSKSFSGGFPAGLDAPAACVANNRTTAGWVATTCTAGTICCSDGLTCADPSHAALTCPVPAKRATGAACTYDADCLSASCDIFGTATTGTCL